MGEVVNLNRARKAKAKVARAVEAQANRIAFGRTKAEKLAAQTEAARAERSLDGAKRED